MDPNLLEVNTKIQNALGHLKRELSSIRAGRANPLLLEEIPVIAYGGRMKMLEVGTISAPQNTLLTVQVWDPSIVRDVEKAIMEANLGLNPSIDGNTVRVPIPPLTAERREEFVKLVHQKGEQAKVEVRQIRAEAKDQIEQAKENSEFGEDEMHRRLELLQKLVDQAGAAVDEQVKIKETDLRQV